MREMKCCRCETCRTLTPDEILLMKNLPCVCGARLKIVGIGKRFGFSGDFYRTELEDESMDF